MNFDFNNYARQLHPWIEKSLEKKDRVYHMAMLAQWLDSTGLTFSAIPNNSLITNISQRGRSKFLGTRLGVPDMIVYINEEVQRAQLPLVFFIKMKLPMAPHTPKIDLEWVEKLNKPQGVVARICYGYEDAIEFIKYYMTEYIEEQDDPTN